MFLLERKQQMLIFFWSSSSELWAIRERFFLAGTKRTCFRSHQRDGCAEETCELSCSCCPPADLPDEQGERSCSAGSPHRAPCHLTCSQSPFSSFPFCTGTWAAFPQMEKHCFASFCIFFQICYQFWPEWKYLKRLYCLKSRLPLLQARLGHS